MAKETRKVIRNQQREAKPTAAERKAELTKPVVQGGASELPDPFGPEQMKSTLSRVGLIVAGVWLVCGLIAAVTQSNGLRYGALGLALVLTIGVVAVLVWTIRRTNKAREMAMLLRGVETTEDRKAALLKLESSGKSDATTLFAKAQLEMQEDPKRALETLESIDLKKELPQVADEARIQRAMIHLTMGQVSLARQLVDNVDPKRQQDIRSKAMVAAICAEAWVRTGESKKAEEILAPYREPDEQLQGVRPQLLRAEAYLYAQTSQLKELRRVLRQMSKIDVRLLGGFLQGKAHPLLMKEAKKMLEQSGAIPRKMMVQRPR